MRVLASIAAIAIVASATRESSADAYAFGGVSSRVRLDISILGFHEGAGVGGWDLENARGLAAFARRADALLPKGAALSIERAVDADETTLILALPSRTERFGVDGAPGYDEVLSVVALARGVPLPPVGPRPALFTVQVLATPVEASAGAFARAIDERGIASDSSFFYEACLPCTVPEAHVLERGADGLYRVVIGIFDRPEPAGAFAVALAKKHALAGSVRAI